MTNAEKFSKGIVVYKNDEDDYVCELWGASTKHPDSIFHMKYDEKFTISPYFSIESQIFQWLCWIASQQNFPPHAEAIVDYAMKNWLVWKENS